MSEFLQMNIMKKYLIGLVILTTAVISIFIIFSPQGDRSKAQVSNKEISLEKTKNVSNTETRFKPNKGKLVQKESKRKKTSKNVSRISTTKRTDLSQQGKKEKSIIKKLLRKSFIDSLLSAILKCETITCFEKLSKDLVEMNISLEDMKKFLEGVKDKPGIYLLTLFAAFEIYNNKPEEKWEKFLVSEILPKLPEYLNFQAIEPKIGHLAIDVLNKYTHYFKDKENVKSLLIGIFTQAIQNASPEIRGVSVISLGNIQDISALSTLRWVIENERDSQVKSYAYWALGSFTRDQIQPLIPLLEEAVKEGDINASATLAKFGSLKGMKNIVNTLSYYANDQYQGTIGTGAVISGLKYLSYSEQEELKKLVEEKFKEAIDVPLKCNLAILSTYLGNKESVKLLWQNLDNEKINSRLRFYIIIAIAASGDKKIIPELEKLSKVGNPTTQRIAKAYLEKLKK